MKLESGRRPRVILYNPPSSAQRKPALPLSLLALAAQLEGEYEYGIVDGNLTPEGASILERAVTETGAGVLGLTVMPGPQLSHAAPLCRRLKQMHPALTIVWGGYFATQHYATCLSAGYVDYVIRGHGEVAFRTLLDALAGAANPASIPGLAYSYRETGEIRANPLAPMPHPDRMPDFPYHRLEMPRYARKTFMGRRTLAHHSSYGCPFSCNFCAAVNMSQGRWLAQSAERTAKATRQLVERWGADAVEFYDNNFFVDEARVAEFAERIIDLGIGWWAEGRVDTLLKCAERTWELLRDSGLRMVFMGAESGSDATLRRMNKGGTATAEKTLAVVERAARFGIVPELAFVVGNPPDPDEDIRQTLEFIRRVKRVNPHSEIIIYTYTPEPLAGELYEQAEAQGFRFPSSLDEWVSPAWQAFSQRRSAHVPWLRQAARRQVRDFESVLNAYFPTTTDPRLKGLRRLVLKAAGVWRYHLRFYRYPLELRALQRFFGYQRPETSGF